MVTALSFRPLHGSPIFSRMLIGRIGADAFWLVMPLALCMIAAWTDHRLFATNIDFSYGHDALSAFGLNVQQHSSSPDFPLLRDTPSIALMLLIGTNTVCMRRLAIALESALPRLGGDAGGEPGVLRWRRQKRPAKSSLDKIVDLVFFRNYGPTPDARAQLIKFCRQREVLVWRLEIWLVMLGAALAGLLIVFGVVHKNFALRAPGDLDDYDSFRWASTAYRQWWAGTSHLAGVAAFGAVATFGIYIILLQNLVSFNSVIILGVLPRFAAFNVDWLNRDGSYGYASIVEIYRTVYVSLAVRAVSLVALFAALGWVSPIPIIIVSIVWVLFLGIYVLIPFLILRSRLERRRATYILRVAVEHDLNPIGDLAAGSEAARLIAAARAANLNPLGLPKFKASGFIAVVLLPVVLTVVQVMAG